MLIPIWNFERKLKMMLNLCYLLHLFRILPITFCSKFKLIRDWCFLKGNSILYHFSKKWKKSNFNVFRAKNAIQVVVENNNLFFEHFSFFFFLNLSWIISICKKFSKEQIRCQKGKHFFILFLCGPILPCVPTMWEEGPDPISRVRGD